MIDEVYYCNNGLFCVFYNIIGLVIFGWKHEGGAIPQMFLIAIVPLIFRLILKKKHSILKLLTQKPIDVSEK